MSPRLRPTSIPSGILIHPSVWPQWHGPKIGGCASLGGAGSPSNTMWPGQRPTSIPSGILISPGVCPQYMDQKVRRGFLRGGEAGSPSNTMLPGLRSTSVSRGILIHPAVFGHKRHGLIIGGCAPFGRGALGPHITQCGRGQGLPPCQVSSWSIQPFGHNTPMSQTRQTTVW